MVVISAARGKDFYMDWECACNLCEDEHGGSVFGWWVERWMLSHGWVQEDLDAREELFEAWKERRGW
jgi:hypothetical protein